MAQEIFFERFMGAIEATRGTAVTPPTHLLHHGGVVTPKKGRRVAEERRGTLGLNYRTAITRASSEWETVAQDADTGSLPWWLNMFVQGGVTTPTTPATATNTRRFTFIRNITADNIKTFTGYWGDPNIQVFQTPFCVGTEMTLSADATAEDGVLMFSAKGIGGPLSKVSAPAVPASIAGSLLPAQWLKCYIDTSSGIGTTAVTGRILKADHTIRTGIAPKYMGAGPASNLSYSAIGREQISAITTKITMEMPDLTYYDLWEAGTTLKVQMQYNGPLIETTFYEKVFVDTYGPISSWAWGENQGTNRTAEITIEGYVDATLGSDLAVVVDSARTTL